MSNASAKPISEYLQVDRRFRRSINIEKDFRGASQNGDYIVTPTAVEALHRLAESLEADSPSRAWTITGPYGVGKSAFAVFLTRLLCSIKPQGIQARERLKKIAPAVSLEFSQARVCQDGLLGFLPILVTARRVAASVCIAEGIVDALKNGNGRKLTYAAKKMEAELRASAPETPLDSRWVVSALETAATAAKESGYQGILIIVDELGKLFEYAARYPQRADVYVLQELAEHVSRSASFPTIFLGLLHQSFEEYGHHLDLGTRREWSKIQGRFGDVAFLEPADQVVRLVAEAIRWNDVAWPRGLKKHIEGVASYAIEAGAVPPGMSKSEFKSAAVAAYPLHPLTLVALPYIFRRFAQNERSLFSYLGSMEPYGFQEYVRTRVFGASPVPFLRLADLFDYFTSNFGLGLFRQPQALRWLEAADVLERKDKLSPIHREIIKTAGILNALGQFSPLSATSQMLSVAVRDNSAADNTLENALQELRESSTLSYRSYNNSYRIWEGSDVDVEERIAEGWRKTQGRLSVAENIVAYLPSRPLVARRHSFVSGALRSFAVHYVDSEDRFREVTEAAEAGDGKVIVCLSESTTAADRFARLVKQLKDRQEILVAIPQEIGELRGAVAELAALRWVWDNTPELRDDRVARREISLRITEAEQLLQRSLNGLLDPRPDPVGSHCAWYHRGTALKVSTPAAVLQSLSDVCDEVFSQTPIIRNELIVRRNLSAAAAGARRNLIEAMLHCADKPLLGIAGFPPERSIYESVLAAGGLHRQDSSGNWRLAAPPRSDKCNLLPAWRFLTAEVFDRQPEPLHLHQLFVSLSKAPLGVLDGLHPLLLCAFMMAHRNEVTLYREGTFLPEPGIADFEVLLRRPELFAIAGSRVTGSRAAVVTRLAKGLGTDEATVPVVRAMFRSVKALPDYAWNTRQLSRETIALREAFQNAKSPERFLFVEVPAALEMPIFSEGKRKPQEIEKFFERLNECLQQWSGITAKTLSTARDRLLKACGMPLGLAGWEALRQAAVKLESSVTEPQLLTFLRRVVQADSGSAGIESVCALVASRPPSNWTDSDSERFGEAADAVGGRFREASSVGTPAVNGHAFHRLSTTERRQADKLVLTLRSLLIPDDKALPTRVVQAALAELAHEVAHKQDE